MKCLIIYFSQTGSTKKVAEAIHIGVKSAGVECDITPVSTGLEWDKTLLQDIDFNTITDYDIIALGTLVAHWKEPHNMAILEESLPDLSGKHCFLFATHGMGRAQVFTSMADKLKRKGLTVIGYRSWYGNCYIHMVPKPYFSDGHPDEIDLKEAEDFGMEMVDHSRRISQGETELIPVILPPVAMTPPVDMLRLTYNKDKCTYPKCGLCMEYCPMGVIDFSVTPPVFQGEGCIDCYLCEKICPTGAINGDFKAEFQSFKENMLYGALRDAERGKEKGYYRPLVDFDEVMKGQPWYRYTKRPRLRLSEFGTQKRKS